MRPKWKYCWTDAQKSSRKYPFHFALSFVLYHLISSALLHLALCSRILRGIIVSDEIKRLDMDCWVAIHLASSFLFQN